MTDKYGGWEPMFNNIEGLILSKYISLVLRPSFKYPPDRFDVEIRDENTMIIRGFATQEEALHYLGYILDFIRENKNENN